MNIKISTIVVLLMSLVLSSCGLGQMFGPTITPTPSPTSIPSPTPSPTPTSTPTSTPTPAPTTGEINGTLVMKSNGEPITNAGIILCRSNEDSCTIDVNFETITDANGIFEFTDVPPDTYLILYNPAGRLWQSVDNLKVEINDKSASCLSEQNIATEDCRGSIPFYDDPARTISETSLYSIGIGLDSTGKPFMLSFFNNGTIVSNKYGLYLNFVDGQPLIVKVKLGEIVEVKIEVWE